MALLVMRAMRMTLMMGVVVVVVEVVEGDGLLEGGVQAVQRLAVEEAAVVVQQQQQQLLDVLLGQKTMMTTLPCLLPLHGA